MCQNQHLTVFARRLFKFKTDQQAAIEESIAAGKVSKHISIPQMPECIKSGRTYILVLMLLE